MLCYYYFVIKYLINELSSLNLATQTKEAMRFSHWS